MSVVIIAYNEEHYLPALLDSLACQTWTRFEVVVADSGSTDRTREAALEYRDRFEAFKTGRTGVCPGPAYARNQAVHHASHERLLFLDADSLLAPDFMQRAAAALTVRAPTWRPASSGSTRADCLRGWARCS